MRKVILLILVFLSVVAILLRFASKPLSDALGLRPRAGIRVEANLKSKVFICQKVTSNPCDIENSEVGVTPYQDESLTEGEYLVRVKSEEGNKTWQGYINLNAGTLSVINRELGDTPALSSGEVMTLGKGTGVTIISTPSNAEVTVDGKVRGRTPLSLPDVSGGEHQLLISKDDFLKRSIRVNLEQNFALTLGVDLAIAEADLTKVTTPAEPPKTTEIVILKTPTNFLRVRNAPSVSAKEIGRVNTGDTLVLLEELPSWDRVRMPDGKEGYVSSAYTQKK